MRSPVTVGYGVKRANKIEQENYTILSNVMKLNAMVYYKYMILSWP